MAPIKDKYLKIVVNIREINEYLFYNYFVRLYGDNSLNVYIFNKKQQNLIV